MKKKTSKKPTLRLTPITNDVIDSWISYGKNLASGEMSSRKQRKECNPDQKNGIIEYNNALKEMYEQARTNRSKAKLYIEKYEAKEVDDDTRYVRNLRSYHENDGIMLTLADSYAQIMLNEKSNEKPIVFDALSEYFNEGCFIKAIDLIKTLELINERVKKFNRNKGSKKDILETLYKVFTKKDILKPNIAPTTFKKLLCEYYGINKAGGGTLTDGAYNKKLGVAVESELNKG